MLSVLIPNHNEPNIDKVISLIEANVPATEIVIACDKQGKGKGWAMRQALSQCRGERVAFMDGDMDIEPRMLKRLLPYLEDYDIVVGSKKMTHAPLHRKIITHLSRIYIRIVFGLPWDTQTGLKLFRREALRVWETDSFAFPIEIMATAKRRGLKIIEIPIEAEITAPMSWRAVWLTLKSSLRIRFLLSSLVEE